MSDQVYGPTGRQETFPEFEARRLKEEVAKEIVGRLHGTLPDYHHSGADIPKPDSVNHPPHYTFGKIEVIDVLEDWQLPYHLACVVKYIARHGKKDPAKKLEDLKKAQWYLSRYIEELV